MQRTDEQRAASFVRWWWGWAAGMIVFYAAAQPLATFADPWRLLVAGFAAGWAIIAGYCENFLDGVAKVVALIVAILFVGWAGNTISEVVRDAKAASEMNDRRCLLIEVEMMRGSPRRSDLPDMFQAFKCRPQTNAMPRRPAPLPPVSSPDGNYPRPKNSPSSSGSINGRMRDRSAGVEPSLERMVK